MAGRKEITAIAILLSINAFFGLSDKTTRFFFPEFGQEVFTIINFYLLAIVVFTVIVIWLELKHGIPELPKIPSIWALMLNFAIFFIPGYFIISWILQGTISTVPAFSIKNFIEQGIVASDENLLAFILLPTIFPYGSGVGNLLKKPVNFIKYRDYSLNFNPPDFNRFKYGLIAIVMITVLHAGSYSYQVADVGSFYISLLIAFGLFCALYWIKESYGFGSCVALHLAWNMVLLSTRGSII